jgi:hypothetical protein
MNTNKDVAPDRRLPDGPHARLLGVGIGHNRWLAQQHLLDLYPG